MQIGKSNDINMQNLRYSQKKKCANGANVESKKQGYHFIFIQRQQNKKCLEKSQVGRWTISKFKSYMIPAIDCTLLWTKLAQALAQ